MRRRLLTLLLFIPLIGVCQQQEFDLYAGLLYSSTDMQELKKTADSLNLRYLQCVPHPEYHSWPQTEALCYELEIQEKQLSLLEARLKKQENFRLRNSQRDQITCETTSYYF